MSDFTPEQWAAANPLVLEFIATYLEALPDDADRNASTPTMAVHAERVRAIPTEVAGRCMIMPMQHVLELVTLALMQKGAAAEPTATCPQCGQPVTPELMPIAMMEDGMPAAASVVEGLGVPIVAPESTHGWHIHLDGVPVDGVVAFDRPNGVLWCHQRDAMDNRMRRDGKFLLEKRTGIVTLKSTSEAGQC